MKDVQFNSDGSGLAKTTLSVVLRAVGFTVFLLLAVGYYREGHPLHAVFSSVIGGIAVCRADRFPRGPEAKAISLVVGLVLIVVLHPVP